MSKTRFIAIVSFITIVALVAANFPLNSAKADASHGHKSKKPLSLEKIHADQLPAVSNAIDKAIKDLNAGKKDSALIQLHKARKLIAMITEGIGTHVKPKFANATCPIMNSVINPDKITKNLTRQYKGQNIAFCCAGCPAQWDKLTADEKTVKLAKAMPKPAKKKSGHKH